MKQITINNVTYKSFAAAHREIADISISYALARKRLSRGWPPELTLIVPPIAPQERRTGIQL